MEELRVDRRHLIRGDVPRVVPWRWIRVFIRWGAVQDWLTGLSRRFEGRGAGWFGNLQAEFADVVVGGGEMEDEHGKL